MRYDVLLSLCNDAIADLCTSQTLLLANKSPLQKGREKLSRGTILVEKHFMKSQNAQPYVGSLEHKIYDVTQRLALLEERVFKKAKRNRATEAQRFLLHYYLGGITPIMQNGIASQKQRDLLVSVLLDIDADNARKFLSELSKKEKPLLNTESNYSFLVNVFKEAVYPELEKKAATVLLSILNKKGK